jgi:hypothetical protein
MAAIGPDFLRCLAANPLEELMNRLGAAFAALALATAGLFSQVHAAPPTVTPSPGYDARLQEQHAVLSAQPVEPAPAPMVQRHRKRTHHATH